MITTIAILNVLLAVNTLEPINLGRNIVNTLPEPPPIEHNLPRTRPPVEDKDDTTIKVEDEKNGWATVNGLEKDGTSTITFIGIDDSNKHIYCSFSDYKHPMGHRSFNIATLHQYVKSVLEDRSETGAPLGTYQVIVEPHDNRAKELYSLYFYARIRLKGRKNRKTDAPREYKVTIEPYDNRAKGRKTTTFTIHPEKPVVEPPKPKTQYGSSGK